TYPDPAPQRAGRHRREPRRAGDRQVAAVVGAARHVPSGGIAECRPHLFPDHVPEETPEPAGDIHGCGHAPAPCAGSAVAIGSAGAGLPVPARAWPAGIIDRTRAAPSSADMASTLPSHSPRTSAGIPDTA